ncbi:hypothetical protein QE152_g32257 [Popillia japonica]|uniref:Uncharacterized protein n=1 Tax=Popillia japonica TaxID=7064 RepID=A0AAW1IZN0_POPJA
MVLRIYNSCEHAIAVEDNQTLEIDENNYANNVENIPENRSITLDMLNIADDISENQKLESYDLIQEYQDCIALSFDELGCTNIMTMDIIDSNIPVRCHPQTEKQ